MRKIRLVIHCYYENCENKITYIRTPSTGLTYDGSRNVTFLSPLDCIIDMVANVPYSPLDKLWKSCFHSLALYWKRILRPWSSVSVCIIREPFYHPCQAWNWIQGNLLFLSGLSLMVGYQKDPWNRRKRHDFSS